MPYYPANTSWYHWKQATNAATYASIFWACPASQTQTVAMYGAGSYASYVFGNEMVESEEERSARQQKAMEAARRTEVAATRAEELLFRFISNEQKNSYIAHGHFDVPVNGKIYRIHKGHSMNIALLEDGLAKIKLCAHPQDCLPTADTVLAQYLMLSCDEPGFLALANKRAVGEQIATGYIPAPVMANVADPLAVAEEEFFAGNQIAVAT